MRRAALMLLLITMLSLGVAHAQDAYESPLLSLLATVPDTANNRTQLMLNDRTAIEAAYAPARMPADFEEFVFVSENDDDLSDDLLPVLLWTRIYMGMASSSVGRYMALGDEMPGVLGFDYFDVLQELSYGMPPEQTLHLIGDFDGEAIRAALTTQGYAQVDAPADEVWCPEAACDMGTMMDVDRRNPANLFGGEIGRRFPLFVTETAILGSPSEGVVNEHIAVATGEQPSLADAPDYLAAAEALTRDGMLMQAAFYPPEATQPAVVPGEGLPAYRLLALGDVATSEAQQARVVLVYDDTADAERAAQLLPTLLDLPSERSERPWSEFLADRQVSDITSEVLSTGSGLPAVVLTLSGARGTPEQILEVSARSSDVEPTFAVPGIAFRAVMNGLASRDLPWLAIGEP